MALYLVKRVREYEITRKTEYEAEIEVADDADEIEIEKAAKRLRDGRWKETDEWDDVDRFTDSYEVVERLDITPETVKGRPEDFGLVQEALLV